MDRTESLDSSIHYLVPKFHRVVIGHSLAARLLDFIDDEIGSSAIGTLPFG